MIVPNIVARTRNTLEIAVLMHLLTRRNVVTRVRVYPDDNFRSSVTRNMTAERFKEKKNLMLPGPSPSRTSPCMAPLTVVTRLVLNVRCKFNAQVSTFSLNSMGVALVVTSSTLTFKTRSTVAFTQHGNFVPMTCCRFPIDTSSVGYGNWNWVLCVDLLTCELATGVITGTVHHGMVMVTPL